ncbi:MAG: DUF3800 domain-containing protein, partial [Phycisphaerales bacterium]|nr:DUF3800 domain-containing protein [Phycisphaerales bacterium]
MAELFNIYCDESCHLIHDRSPVMVLGCVWCPRDRVAEISTRLREIKRECGLVRAGDYAEGRLPFELKWQKVSPGKLAYYLRVVDYFFDDDDLHFRSIIIPEKGVLRHKDFGQDHDTWYYKMCFCMLEAVIDPRQRYNVYLDMYWFSVNWSFGRWVFVTGRPSPGVWIGKDSRLRREGFIAWVP